MSPGNYLHAIVFSLLANNLRVFNVYQFAFKSKCCPKTPPSILESLEGGCQILQYDRNRRDSFVCIVGIEFIEDQINFHGQDLRLLT